LALTPQFERHFTATEMARDVVIGMDPMGCQVLTGLLAQPATA